MQIDRIIFPVETLGPGKRLVIWTIGCPHHCNKCSNPELWDANPTKDVPVEDIFEIIKKQSNIDGVAITGGDPFAQPEELLRLVDGIVGNGIDDILIYTGFLYESLKENQICKQIINKISALVDGPYIDELNDNIGLRGSSNQRLFILNRKYEERYNDFEYAKRQRQNFVSNGTVVSVGIPIR